MCLLEILLIFDWKDILDYLYHTSPCLSPSPSASLHALQPGFEADIFIPV